MKKKATKKVSRTKKVVDEQESYKATVKVLGKTYEATGETAKEAISNLKTQNCKGRSILIVEKNGVKKEKIIMPSLTFRLFNTAGFSKEVAIKNASLLFQGL